MRERFANAPFTFLDLCAGSGAIGLAILNEFPAALVSFAELIPEHCALIRKNIELNELDSTRATIYESDLFSAFQDDALKFDCIATNPPYIPQGRTLDMGVIDFEPHEALFAGNDGLALIRKIASEASQYLLPDGELWLECDESNARESQVLLAESGATRARLLDDLYGRPRLVVSYFPS